MSYTYYTAVTCVLSGQACSQGTIRGGRTFLHGVEVRGASLQCLGGPERTGTACRVEFKQQAQQQ